MGAFESGQSLLAGVLAKLPKEQRAQAEEIFKAAEAKDAVTILGDSALARSDYSKSMDQLREKEQTLNQYHEQLSGWYDVNKSALEQARDAIARGQQPQPPIEPARPQPALQSPGLSQEDIRRVADDAINDAGRDYIAVSAFISTAAARHYAMFNEPLDAMEIVNNPKVGRPIVGQPGRVFSLQDAYNERYGEKVQAKTKEADEKRFNDEVEKRMQARAAQSPAHPFPLRSEGAPLDVLSTKDGTAAHTLDSAVAEYERLQAGRGGS